MASKKFIQALELLESEKGIEKEVVLEALKEALEKSYKKNYGILTGRLYDCVPEIWNSMNILKSSNSLSYSGSRCTIIPGSKKDNSVAVGAAISAYYHKYSYRTEEINWARH